MTVLYVAAVVVGVLIAAAAVYSQRVASARQQTAQSWSGDNVQFAATGLRGNNLHAYLPDGDQVECDIFVDNVLMNREVAAQMKAAGFARVQCGQRTGELR